MNQISIVIPSYNHGKYIEACLDSIYFQDYPEIEIIIIDDNSIDNSHSVIKNWIHNVKSSSTSFISKYDEKKDELIKTIYNRYNKNVRKIIYEKNSKNIGSTATYNKGFRIATGEYCTFVAADDITHPQMLSTLAKPLDENAADFVYSNMFIIDDNHQILREFILPDYSFEKSFCEWYLCGVSTLYRRSLHETFGYYDENSHADDHECYLRFALNGARLLHINKTLYSVRSHAQRQVGLHHPEKFKNLLEESKRLVLKARISLHAKRSSHDDIVVIQP
ncbi:glycosyltransferase involved in cell wall biosynthesis [Desulfomicrobium macestii]|uniref:Glycosyltransferase involved in cell wall biosynthesis n=1 Tax=Desulfomicrobium macestii TaxID=90731 RepID=A0ABR9H6S0_9BACT|nr:glycosyltransferase [Desulfomicrobium macestii]MBE1426409.1 glycosyltransferase involved in cell wall biosynthesis [Desulfomicrobium macestii]